MRYFSSALQRFSYILFGTLLVLLAQACGQDEGKSTSSKTLAVHNDRNLKLYRVSISGGLFSVYKPRLVVLFPARGSGQPHAHEICESSQFLETLGFARNAVGEDIVIDANYNNNTDIAKDALEKWWFFKLTTSTEGGIKTIKTAEADTPKLDCALTAASFKPLKFHKDAQGEQRLFLEWKKPYSDVLYEVGCLELLKFWNISLDNPGEITDLEAEADDIFDLSCSNGTKARRESCGNAKIGEDFDETIKDSLGTPSGRVTYTCRAGGTREFKGMACFDTFGKTKSNGCEKDCPGAHKVETDWWEDLTDKTGRIQYKCEAKGERKVLDVTCTAAGYKRSGNACVKVFCSSIGKAFGETASEVRPEGTYTRKCLADGTAPIVETSCNTGWTKKDLTCQVNPNIKGHTGNTTFAIDRITEKSEPAFALSFDDRADGKTYERITLPSGDCGSLVTFSLNPNIKDVYNYKVTWGKSPLRSCKVSVRAKTSVAASSALELTFNFTATCAQGEKLDAENKCVKELCTDGHQVGDPWTTTLTESDGKTASGAAAYICSVEKKIIQSSATCNTGYQKISAPTPQDPNAKSCKPLDCPDSSHPHGTEKTIDVNPGSYKLLCKYGQTSKVSGSLTCPSGYDKDSANWKCSPKSCYDTDDKTTHAHGTNWNIGVKDGVQPRSCSLGAIKSGDITCTTPYAMYYTGIEACMKSCRSGRDWIPHGHTIPGTTLKCSDGSAMDEGQTWN